LATLSRNDGSEADLTVIRKRIGTVGDRARCSLAGQQQAVVGSILDAFGAEFDAHVLHLADGTEPALITELREIDADGVARWDPGFLDKKPDWTYDAEWSGKVPADLQADHRRPD
jgi:NADH-quinone oxidoreductase subunit F